MMKRRKKRKNRYKVKWKNLIILIILLISICAFIISGYNIFIWNKDNKSINNQLDKIKKLVKVKSLSDSDNDKSENKDESNMYYDYMNMDLMDVDFNELSKINKDTKGWIKVNGTNINYPFVQTNDNEYYLTHAFDKSYNKAGWVFVDYRNKLDGMDKNTILYAHGRLNKTMFGTLRNILKNGWLNNKENYVVKISTKKENSLWQVFSVYKIPETSDYIQTDFTSNDEFKEFANMLLKRSMHDFDTSVDSDDKILTLSTCYDKQNRLVLHAKLIKKSDK